MNTLCTVHGPAKRVDRTKANVLDHSWYLLAPSSFLLLVVRPGAPSSVLLVPSPCLESRLICGECMSHGQCKKRARPRPPRAVRARVERSEIVAFALCCSGSVGRYRKIRKS